MKKIIQMYRNRPACTCVCIALSLAVALMASVFVSPWLGALMILAAVVLLDEPILEERV